MIKSSIAIDPITTEDYCLPCSTLCQTCSGSKISDCSACFSPVDNMDPVTCLCLEGYFYDASQTTRKNACQACHSFCLLCSGTPKSCTRCKSILGVNLIGGSKCECSPAGYFVYANTITGEDECLPCHPLCLNCYGSTTSQCTLCNSAIGGTMISGVCQCSSGYFYNSQKQLCERCSPLCAQCSGPTFSDCLSCATFAIPVDQLPTVCVKDCLDISQYYYNAGKCYKCDSTCLRCYGDTPDTCFSCFDKNKVVLEGTCVASCPQTYFASEGVCYHCHSSCLSCFSSDSRSCLSCPNSLLLHLSQCVSECPSQYYQSLVYCKPCINSCFTCTSASYCLSCVAGSYMFPSENKCVSGALCPQGTFPDDETRSCALCDKSCTTCIGPTSSDCIVCNYLLGYTTQKDAGTPICVELFCGTGYFRKATASSVTCEACHYTCTTCDSAEKNACLSCTKPYQTSVSTIKNHVACKRCFEINSGLMDTEAGDCTEICGDGINLGYFECDDGNSLSGDGCSKTCKVEEGYKCQKVANSADICRDTKSPTATLAIKRGQDLDITFSETMRLNNLNGNANNSEKLSLEEQFERYVTVALVNVQGFCSFTWKLFNPDSLLQGESFQKIHINTTIGCNLRGKVEEFVWNLTEGSFITDMQGNNLSTPLLKANALRYYYSSDLEKKAVAGAGSTFSAAGIATFASACGIILFQYILRAAFS